MAHNARCLLLAAIAASTLGLCQSKPALAQAFGAPPQWRGPAGRLDGVWQGDRLWRDLRIRQPGFDQIDPLWGNGRHWRDPWHWREPWHWRGTRYWRDPRYTLDPWRYRVHGGLDPLEDPYLFYRGAPRRALDVSSEWR